MYGVIPRWRKTLSSSTTTVFDSSGSVLYVRPCWNPFGAGTKSKHEGYRQRRETPISKRGAYLRTGQYASYDTLRDTASRLDDSFAARWAGDDGGGASNVCTYVPN
ncbi:hypothetical protein WN55_02469 [Dufourea novaeangliae]|uniref:Uncharacterized protein n=1 Tax=Dufourea novaeangliae TaxID=178035 RepID=A0A154PIG4_DUFNO|nr:hypothetical protein WN55_02469 [Dufourea novaeangliae]